MFCEQVWAAARSEVAYENVCRRLLACSCVYVCYKVVRFGTHRSHQRRRSRRRRRPRQTSPLLSPSSYAVVSCSGCTTRCVFHFVIGNFVYEPHHYSQAPAHRQHTHIYLEAASDLRTAFNCHPCPPQPPLPSPPSSSSSPSRRPQSHHRRSPSTPQRATLGDSFVLLVPCSPFRVPVCEANSSIFGRRQCVGPTFRFLRPLGTI